MIPIGAPVTATWSTGKKANFIIHKYKRIGSHYKYDAQSCNDGTYCVFNDSEVKIRYDNPAPFTLWQLNALTNMEANTTWVPGCNFDLICIENVLDPRSVAQDPIFS